MDGIDFLLQLNDKFEGPTNKADSALAQLERQIVKTQGAITAYEDKLDSAAKKLSELEKGAPNPAAVAAFQKQSDAVRGLEEQLQAAKTALDLIGSGQLRVNPAEIKKAENQFVSLTEKLEAARAKQAKLGAQIGPRVDEKAVGKQRELVAGLEKNIAKQKESKAALEGAVPRWQALSKSMGDGGKGLKDLASVAQGAGGPLGSLAGRASQLTQLLGKAGLAGGAVAAVAAIVAVIAVAIAAAVALTKYALASADAARSSALLSVAAAGSAKGGAEVEAVVSQLARTVPIARDKLAEMARELELGKFEGREMQAALTAIATTSSAVGETAAGKIRSIAESSKQARRFLLGAKDVYGEFLSLAGTRIKAADIYAALAEQMKISIPQAKALIDSGAVSVANGMKVLERATQTKFGGTVAAQMNSLTNIFAKLKENLAGLFSGINIEKFLAGLRDVASIFDQDTFSGWAFKKVITDVFNSIFDLASKVFPYVRMFLLGIAIGSVAVLLGFKLLKRWISDTFGGESASKIDWLSVAMWAGVAAVGALVGVLVGLAAILAIVLVPLAVLGILVVAPFVVAGIVIYGVVKAFMAMGAAISAAVNKIRSISLIEIGAQIIDGLINGIKAKIGAIGDAMKAVGETVKGGVKKALGIKSPSTVMAKYGEYTAEGFELGMRRGSGGVEDARDEMTGAAIPEKGAIKAMAKGGNYYEIHQHFEVGLDDVVAKVREAVEELFEAEAVAT